MFPACDLPSLFRFFIWPEYAVALQEFCNFCKIPHQLDPENSCFFNRRVSAGFCKNCKILQKGRGSGYVKYLKSNRFLHMVMRSLPRQKDRFATTLQNCKSYCKKGDSIWTLRQQDTLFSGNTLLPRSLLQKLQNLQKGR